jgi:hypothetical protein
MWKIRTGRLRIIAGRQWGLATQTLSTAAAFDKTRNANPTKVTEAGDVIDK